MSGSLKTSVFTGLPMEAPKYGEKGKKLWRPDDPELDSAGNLTKGGMWNHQRSWWDLPNFCKVLVGGYGSGKTITVCKRGIAVAIDNAPAPVAIVSPTYNLARQTTVATIQALLAGKQTLFGARAFRWRYNKNEHVFTIVYRGRKSTIQILSGDNPDSLRGPNIAAAYIDEPFIQDKAVYEQMIARVRHPEAKIMELGLSGTPEELNWGYDLCMGELEELNDVGVIQASTRDNRVLSPDYVKRLEGALDEKTAEAYIEGSFVNLAKGVVYHAFSQTDNVVTLSRPDGSELGIGMDFNVDPMAFVLFWYTQSHIHFMREFEFNNTDTEYVCEFLREHFWDDGLRDIFPDSSGRQRRTSAPGGKTDFYYIEAAGFTVNAKAASPLRRDRYNAANGAFKPRRGRVAATVDPRCKKMARYMQTYTHERMNKKDGKAMSHLLDAATYPISYLFPADKNAIVGETRYTGA